MPRILSWAGTRRIQRVNPVYTLLVRAVLSVVFVVLYGWLVIAVLGREQEFVDGVKEVLLVLVGALTQSVMRVLSFWFDSSQGSVEKSVALARAVEGKDV